VKYTIKLLLFSGNYYIDNLFHSDIVFINEVKYIFKHVMSIKQVFDVWKMCQKVSKNAQEVSKITYYRIGDTW